MWREIFFISSHWHSISPFNLTFSSNRKLIFLWKFKVYYTEVSRKAWKSLYIFRKVCNGWPTFRKEEKHYFRDISLPLQNWSDSWERKFCVLRESWKFYDFGKFVSLFRELYDIEICKDLGGSVQLSYSKTPFLCMH